MKTAFDIVLVERYGENGLTKADTMDLYDLLKGEEAYPIEIENSRGDSSVMGFLSVEAAKELEYEEAGLRDYVRKILSGEIAEDPDGNYIYQGLDLYVARN